MSETGVQQNGSSVLVADDDRMMRAMLRHILESEGYVVQEAPNGVQALAVFERLHPDIVLLDINMPGMDGFTTCVRLRALPGSDHVPVLMVTALDDKKAIDRAFEAGSTDYITKPINKDVLRNRVRYLLRAGQVEAALRESEERMRSVLETAPDWILNVDRDGTIAFINRTVPGATPEETIGTNVCDHIPPQHHDTIKESIERVFQTGQPVSIELVINPEGQGNRMWQSCRIGPMKHDGQVVAATIISTDITERKRAEREIKERRRYLEAVLAAAPNAIITMDADRRIVEWNRGAEKLFGYTREEAIGQDVDHLITNPDTFEEAAQFTQFVISGKDLPPVKAVRYRKDGSPVDVLLSGSPILMEDELIEAIGIYTDLTERVRMEEALLASQKLADLGTLAAGVAHEMNSPLQVITGTSQSLLKRLDRDALDPDRLRHNLDVIHRNSWRCAEITRSLRTYAHASPGQFEPSDLNALLHDTLLLIEHQLKSWSNIAVVTDLAPDLPPLHCNQNQITQVLINLLSNARDAMPQGGEITIRTGYAPHSSRLTLQVTDNGVGIPESICTKIFDPFFTTKPVGQGTGLGLSIVQGIIRAHGGEIEVYSKPGHGTTFTLLFPEKPPPAAELSQRLTGGRFNDTTYHPQQEMSLSPEVTYA